MKLKVIVLTALFIAAVLLLSSLFIVTEEKREWLEADKTDTLRAYEEFIVKYPDGKYREDANKKIISLLVEDLQERGTIRKYKAFLERFPEASVAEQIRKDYDDIFFSEIVKFPSLYSYNKYLETFPAGKHRTEADKERNVFLAERTPVVRNSKNVLLVANIETPSGVDMPFKYEAEFLLQAAGLNIIKSDTEKSADILLTVNAVCEPLDMSYQDRGTQYTGATINGEIILKQGNNVLVKKDFSGYEGCLKSVGHDDYSRKSDAPFLYAYANSNYAENLLDIMIAQYGENLLTASILFDDSLLQRQSAKFLITRLKNNDKRAAKLLGSSIRYGTKDFALETIRNVWHVKSNYLIDTAIEAVKNTDETVKADSITLIKKLRDPKAVPTLIELLYSKYYDIRARAAITLGDIRRAEAVPYLVKLLHDEHPFPRAAAAKALGKIGDKKAIEPLIEALKDNHSTVNDTVYTALCKITGVKPGRSHAEWQKWFKSL